MNVGHYRLTARESEAAATGWALHFFFFFSRRWWGGGVSRPTQAALQTPITFLSQTPSSFFSPLAANKEYTRDRLLGNRGKVQNYRFPSSFSFFYNGDLMHFLIRQGGGIGPLRALKAYHVGILVRLARRPLQIAYFPALSESLQTCTIQIN